MRLRHALLPALTSVAVIAALASPAAAATSGSVRDFDRDGMPDRWEAANKLNPKRGSDAKKDADKDGLTNLQEYRLGGDPRSADTDRDGLGDGLEATLKTKLGKVDSDGDGIMDGDDDANRDGICDRDHREALGTIVSFDETTGELVLTTRSKTSRTVVLTDFTDIEQRERKGWAHRPGGPLSNGPESSDDSDDSDDSSIDDSDAGSGVFDDDEWVQEDGGDLDGESADDLDFFDDLDDFADDGPDVVDPYNVELLTGGTVLLKVKIGDDDTVEELRLA